MQSNFFKVLSLGLVGIGLAAAPALAAGESAGSSNSQSTPGSNNVRGAVPATDMSSGKMPMKHRAGKMTGSMHDTSAMHSRRGASDADHSADQLNAQSLAATQSGQQYMPGMAAPSGKKM